MSATWPARGSPASRTWSAPAATAAATRRSRRRALHEAGFGSASNRRDSCRPARARLDLRQPQGRRTRLVLDHCHGSSSSSPRWGAVRGVRDLVPAVLPSAPGGPAREVTRRWRSSTAWLTRSGASASRPTSTWGSHDHGRLCRVRFRGRPPAPLRTRGAQVRASPRPAPGRGPRPVGGLRHRHGDRLCRDQAAFALLLDRLDHSFLNEVDGLPTRRARTWPGGYGTTWPSSLPGPGVVARPAPRRRLRRGGPFRYPTCPVRRSTRPGEPAPA